MAVDTSLTPVRLLHQLYGQLPSMQFLHADPKAT
jgi:hypothetical protein